MIAFLMAHSDVVLGALFALSEVLAQIPGIKANSVFQMIVSLILKLKG
jgi:hypothetical protein